MKLRGAVVASLLALALPGLAVPARADTPQQQADKLFAEGRELLMNKNDAQGACEKFEAAISLDATATGTMLNLGLCYEKLGKYAQSIKWFRKAQAAAAEAHLAEYENAAKEHTVKIAPMVPSVTFDLGATPDAEIRVDGEKVDRGDLGRKELDPGDHAIEGRTPGKKKVMQQVTLAQGESKTIKIEFTEDAVPVYVDQGKGRRRAGIILAAGGLAGLAFSGIYSKIEANKWHAAEGKPGQDDTQDDIQKKVRYIGTGVFIVGAGALTAGVILYLTAPGKEKISDGTAFVPRLTPTLTPDQVGFAYSGRF